MSWAFLFQIENKKVSRRRDATVPRRHFPFSMTHGMFEVQLQTLQTGKETEMDGLLCLTFHCPSRVRARRQYFFMIQWRYGSRTHFHRQQQFLYSYSREQALRQPLSWCWGSCYGYHASSEPPRPPDTQGTRAGTSVPCLPGQGGTDTFSPMFSVHTVATVPCGPKVSCAIPTPCRVRSTRDTPISGITFY